MLKSVSDVDVPSLDLYFLPFMNFLFVPNFAPP